MNDLVSFKLRNRNPDVLTCIANLSNDEVFTPPELANKILDTLKTIIDFDHTRDTIPAGIDQALLRQLAAVANRQTDLHLGATVPT